MKVKLRNPDREVEVTGPKTVRALLTELDIIPEAVLVIRDKTLLTRDEAVSESDELEVRPVLSGGARSRPVPVCVVTRSLGQSSAAQAPPAELARRSTPPPVPGLAGRDRR